MGESGLSGPEVDGGHSPLGEERYVGPSQFRPNIKALRKGNITMFGFWWLLTILFGVEFLVGTGMEWYGLIADEGLTIASAPGEEAWLSGGRLLSGASDVKWTRETTGHW